VAVTVADRETTIVVVEIGIERQLQAAESDFAGYFLRTGGMNALFARLSKWGNSETGTRSAFLTALSCMVLVPSS